jgi:threonine/homoserine/homoserine lactone efflux protein
MPPLDNTLTAFFTGLVAGFLVSIFSGPINLTIINEGARRGFIWALMIGFGSLVMESVYCAIALVGFTAFLQVPVVRSVMEMLSFLFLLYLSWKYFKAKTIPDHTHGADVIEQKLHPRSAFGIGFIRVLGNPAIVLLWATLSAVFLSRNWIDETMDDRLACTFGVAAGASVWFLLLAYAASRGHGKMSPRVLLRMEHVSGAILLAIALWLGAQIVWQLHLHRQEMKRERREATTANPASGTTLSNTAPRQTSPDDPARVVPRE